MGYFLAFIATIFFSFHGGDSAVSNQTSLVEKNTAVSAGNGSADVVGAILPHHLLVALDIRKVYADLAARYQFDTVVIISPNHFNSGFLPVQSTLQLRLPKYVSVSANISRTDFTPLLAKPQIMALFEAKVAFEESDELFSHEHGIVSHFGFLEQYFPDAKILPISLKRGTSQQRLAYLAETLGSLDMGRTLVIASIDFSHYTEETIALEEDERTMAWLRDWSRDPSRNTLAAAVELATTRSTQPDAVAMDSPETFTLFLDLMARAGNTHVNVVQRTSSASLLGGSGGSDGDGRDGTFGGSANPADNTSHLFVVME